MEFLLVTRGIPRIRVSLSFLFFAGQCLPYSVFFVYSFSWSTVSSFVELRCTYRVKQTVVSRHLLSMHTDASSHSFPFLPSVDGKTKKSVGLIKKKNYHGSNSPYPKPLPLCSWGKDPRGLSRSPLSPSSSGVFSCPRDKFSDRGGHIRKGFVYIPFSPAYADLSLYLSVYWSIFVSLCVFLYEHLVMHTSALHCSQVAKGEVAVGLKNERGRHRERAECISLRVFCVSV